MSDIMFIPVPKNSVKTKNQVVRCLLMLTLLYNSCSVAMAQVSGDCKAIFTTAFNNFRASTGDRYAMSYVVETTLINDVVSHEQVEVRINGQRSYMKSGFNTVFRDDEHTLVIDYKRRVIFITGVADASARAAGIEKMISLQDSLVNNLVGISCEYITSEKNWIRVSIDDQSDLVKSMGLESLDYWIDKSSEKIGRINTRYVPDNPQFKEIKISFTKYNKHFNGNAFEGTALSQIYNEEGTLLSTYEGFRVINSLREYNN